MNIFNLIISILLCGAAGTTLYFTMEGNQKKENFMGNAEVKSAKIVDIAKAFDELIALNPETTPAGKLERQHLTLHGDPAKNKNISTLKNALVQLRVLSDAIETYRNNLAKTTLEFARLLKLECVSTDAKITALTEKLNNADTLSEGLDEILKDAHKIRLRDDALIAQLRTIANNLKLDASAVAAITDVNAEYSECFDKVFDAIRAMKKRASDYESALQTMASNAGVSSPSLSGENDEVRSNLDNLISGIRSKYSEISQKQGELEGLNAQVAALEATRAERDATIAALTGKKADLDGNITNLRSQIWEPDEGEPIPYIIQDNDYKLKYELLRGTIITTNPAWKMMQIDIGRALVVEQPIGTTGKTNKILCPVLPGYELDIIRKSGNENEVIGKARITSVGEYASIADIVYTAPTKRVRAGDQVIFSAPVIEKIHADLGGAVAKPDNGNEGTEGDNNDFDDLF